LTLHSNLLRPAGVCRACARVLCFGFTLLQVQLDEGSHTEFALTIPRENDGKQAGGQAPAFSIKYSARDSEERDEVCGPSLLP
jgi:hypothetical protein